jgi:hypothetical protein
MLCGVSRFFYAPVDSTSEFGIIARMIAMNTPLKTTQEVAQIFGVTDGRIRQIGRQEDIGAMIGGTRVFTPSDIRKIERIPGLRKIGKKSRKMD